MYLVQKLLLKASILILISIDRHFVKHTLNYLPCLELYLSSFKEIRKPFKIIFHWRKKYDIRGFEIEIKSYQFCRKGENVLEL
jgi:hypothetical protein